MSGLDSISLDADGFLDMNSFSDGSDLSDDAVAGLHDALLADPVDEPGDDDWSVLVDEVVADAGEQPADGGPFAVEDDDAFAGVRDASDDDPADDGPTPDDDPFDDDDGPVIDDTTADDDADDGSSSDTDTDIDLEVDGGDPGDLIGFDLLDGDADLDLGDDATTDLVYDAESEPAAEISHDFEDYL